jgi:hypothetical protein
MSFVVSTVSREDSARGQAIHNRDAVKVVASSWEVEQTVTVILPERGAVTAAG